MGRNDSVLAPDGVSWGDYMPGFQVITLAYAIGVSHDWTGSYHSATVDSNNAIRSFCVGIQPMRDDVTS